MARKDVLGLSYPLTIDVEEKLQAIEQGQS